MQPYILGARVVSSVHLGKLLLLSRSVQGPGPGPRRPDLCWPQEWLHLEEGLSLRIRMALGTLLVVVLLVSRFIAPIPFSASAGPA